MAAAQARLPARSSKPRIMSNSVDDEFFRELCFDVGIATLPPIAFGTKAGKAMLDHLQKEVREADRCRKICCDAGW